MGEIFTVITKLLNAETVGWGLVIAVVTSIFWVVGLTVKNNGQLDVAKEEANVSLNEQGKELVLQVVETLKQEVSTLRKLNADLEAVAINEERLCDLIIAILSAPNQVRLEYELDTAKAYMIKIGKWQDDAQN